MPLWSVYTYVSTQTGQTVFHFPRISRKFNFEHQSKKWWGDRCGDHCWMLLMYGNNSNLCSSNIENKKKIDQLIDGKHTSFCRLDWSLILPLKKCLCRCSMFDVTQNPQICICIYIFAPQVVIPPIKWCGVRDVLLWCNICTRRSEQLSLRTVIEKLSTLANASQYCNECFRHIQSATKTTKCYKRKKGFAHIIITGWK